ncbi:MAG: glycerol-3-phosphate acyltransferase [Betaproteobacteria bacterium RIFCSPLOWO2_02_FULL_67_26]|nr:MAG: glycerol-3-phosphate acyltransferase [Betaproteobacteria bacterium RIFCSPLOWO2_02_FULL_67_26]
MARIGVIGGGAFGTALACVVRRTGHDTAIWAREPEIVAAINDDSVNPVFLKGIRLTPGIRATGNLSEAVAGADFLLLAPPAQHMRGVTGQLRPVLESGTPVVTCSKGVERGTCALMSQVIAETLPGTPVAVLSGPSFAHDIATDQPVGVTLACADRAVGERLVQAIGTPRFRTYLSDDVTGALIGGVLKNVIAIACGVAIGRKLGESTRATLFARGLAEMARLGIAMGARAETFMGLSGAGDLNLSCNSASSRNTSLGIALGEGRRLQDILRERVTVQEGVHSAESVAALARRHDVDMPIVAAVDGVLNHGAGVDEAVAGLLAHPYHFDRATGA